MNKELACFECRELCAFFKGNHGKTSAVAAHSDHISLLRFVLTSHRSMSPASPHTRAARDPGGEKRREFVFPTKTL